MHDPNEALWMIIGIYSISVTILMFEKTDYGKRIYKPLLRVPILIAILSAGAHNALAAWGFVYLFVCWLSYEMIENTNKDDKE